MFEKKPGVMTGVPKIKRALNDNRGFSLLEIIVVIAILAILVTLAALNFGTLRQDAYRTALMADLNTVDKAIAMYNDKYDAYPLRDKYTGTCAAGSFTTTINLDFNTANINDDYYNGKIIEITSGTGAGQASVITDYDFTAATSAIVTISPAFTVAPINTSTYSIYPITIDISSIAGMTSNRNVPEVVKTGITLKPVDGYNKNFMDFVKKTTYLLKGKDSGDERGAGVLYYVDSVSSVNSGTTPDGETTTIELNNATASSVDDFYNGCTVRITNDPGNEQARVISDYDGTNFIATIVGTWDTTPVDNVSTYEVLPPVKSGDLMFIQTAITDNLIIKDKDGNAIYKY